MEEQGWSFQAFMSLLNEKEKLVLSGLLMAIEDEDYEKLMSYPDDALVEILIAFCRGEEEKLPEFLKKYLFNMEDQMDEDEWY